MKHWKTGHIKIMYIKRSFRYFRITDIEVSLLLSQDIQDKLLTFHGHVCMSLQVAYDRHSEVGVVYAKISYVCISFFNKFICLMWTYFLRLSLSIHLTWSTV